jgi:cytochrome c oxidase cbb3-type subunit III
MPDGPVDHDETHDPPIGIDPAAARGIFLGILGLLAGGLVAFYLLKAPAAPPPPEVASDPVLARGSEIYIERCVSCHGPRGRGDGPLARNLPGPPPRDLVEEPWKHGDRPEQVLAVLENGVKDAQMPAWGGTFGPDDLKSVAAYVYHIAGRPVPDGLRAR